MKRKTIEKESFKKVTYAQLALAFFGLIGAAFTFWGTQIKTELEQKKTTYSRMKSLELKIEESQNARMKAEFALIRLQYELEKKVSHLSVIEKYLDDLPTPAWLKKHVGKGEFQMIMINKAYERKYNISKRLYVGKRDSEVWPEDLAKEYKKADVDVITTKSSTKTVEIVVENGIRKEASVYKFYVELGDYEGVGGVVGC